MVLLLAPMSILAAQRDHVVQGRVVDYLKGEGIGNAEVVLMTADSIPVDTCYTYAIPPENTEQQQFNGLFNGINISSVGKYVLQISATGYETECVNIQLRSDREGHIQVPTIRLSKTQSTTLKEVVVRASKVKMVVDGDTIVYNADAFRMEEGSMLDALIKRLPGAKLTEEGLIFVNGKYVQELLVNGKEFFHGNPRVALENLPSYTVDKIKVYHRKGTASEMMGRDMGDQTYVMDVRLKKEYAKGVLANIKGEGGTQKRYNLKGMAMRYTDNSRLVAYGNWNNLNDKGKVSTMGEWKAETMPEGQLINREAGFSYLNFLGDRNSYVSTSNTYNDNTTDSETFSNTQTFLAGGDAFRRATNNSKAGSKTLSSLNRLSLWKRGYFLNSDINLQYTKANNRGHGSLESLLGGTPLNNLQTANRKEANTFSLTSLASGGVRHVADLLRYTAGLNYKNTSSQEFTLYDLKYLGTGQKDLRNNYWDSPVRKMSAQGELSYDIGNIGFLTSLCPSYSYGYQYSNTSNSLYRLDLLADRDSMAFDMLPSARDNLHEVVDQGNSYEYREKTHTHTAELYLSGENDRLFKTSGHWTLRLPLRIATGILDYHRLTDYHIKRRALFFDPSFTINHYDETSWSFEARLKSSLPDLEQCVDFLDTSDPLHVRQGNSDLKNIHYFDTEASWGKYTAKGMQFSTQLAFHLTDNAIAYSMLYNPHTGVSTTRPVNVDGNWHIGTNFIMYSPLGKKQKFGLTNELKPYYYHNVDMAQTEGGQNSMRSIVHNMSLGDELSLEYSPKEGYLLTAQFGGTWNRLTSDRQSFATINAGNYNYGLRAQIPLPWKIDLSTSFINYAHRGYERPEMNTDELVWNINLSKSLLAGKLLLAVKAYDILGQISSRSYLIDSQGRTETVTNVIPRYFLFSATWKFHKSPKKK